MCGSVDRSDDVLRMVHVVGHPFAGGDVADDFADASPLIDGAGVVGFKAVTVAQECRPCAIKLRVLRTRLIADAVRT